MLPVIVLLLTILLFGCGFGCGYGTREWLSRRRRRRTVNFIR